MTRIAICLSSAALLIALLGVAPAVAAEGSQANASSKPAAAPSRQVIACYFHRTVRCPTCQKISAYIEESVKTGFARQIKEGRVKFTMIDFQDPKNQKYTQAYRIAGPTLVVMDVKDGKVVAWKPAPKVWSLVGEKEEFFKYVRGEVQSFLDGKETAAR